MTCWIWDDCLACEALGAELCPACADRVLTAVTRDASTVDEDGQEVGAA